VYCAVSHWTRRERGEESCPETPRGNEEEEGGSEDRKNVIRKRERWEGWREMEKQL